MNSNTGTWTVATVLAMSLMMGCAVTTPEEGEHAGHHPEATASGALGNAAPAEMAEMRTEMAANMKKMQAQMSVLDKTTDPKERAKFLDEHMQTMKVTMQSMQKGGGMMMGEGGMPMQGKAADSDKGGMSMMQMMMDQMMQHQKMMEQMMVPVPAK